MMLEMGKQKGRKNYAKLHQCVNNLKQKYNSLRQACRFADISWTKFHRQTYVKSKSALHKKDYVHKLSAEDISAIGDHYKSDNISFPLPNKKCKGKRFMCYSIKHSVRMYNLAQSTRRQISISTYYCYKPKSHQTAGKNAIQTKLL